MRIKGGPARKRAGQAAKNHERNKNVVWDSFHYKVCHCEEPLVVEYEQSEGVSRKSGDVAISCSTKRLLRRDECPPRNDILIILISYFRLLLMKALENFRPAPVCYG